MRPTPTFLLALLACLSAECPPLCFLLILAAGVCVGLPHRTKKSRPVHHHQTAQWIRKVHENHLSASYFEADKGDCQDEN